MLGQKKKFTRAGTLYIKKMRITQASGVRGGLEGSRYYFLHEMTLGDLAVPTLISDSLGYTHPMKMSRVSCSF